MTGRLADINARIEGISQLGTVMNAMRGIAGARAQQARGQLAAVERYAAGITGAIGQALSFMPARTENGHGPPRPALVIFCAEQGFAGAFSEHVLAAAGAALHTAGLFLIGTRGLAAARERGVTPGWSSPLPAHSAGIPRLADEIAQALYQQIAAAGFSRVDVLFSRFQPRQGITVERQRLLPIDLAAIPRARSGGLPVLNLPPEELLRGLMADYLHAQLCSAGLHGFAAENQARMEAMAAAHQQVERQLESLRSTQRVVRQEEITAEIIELSAGEIASRAII
ncbi:hypothetical protein GCM10010909_25620 [Acidocella aquatica]|uniref:F-type H+-transporting ATPase subunit gamma n=1 Tax=Acidocella aquatica TaxID=1922313 RepID=A0ABQ6A625_9PROT|nr:FoF1 ATP synthase subunit gamma [Acidocella aquatica]GLR67881.1 hypothetical protein GCM10010909_25620 [Acidocella aquatica]